MGLNIILLIVNICILLAVLVFIVLLSVNIARAIPSIHEKIEEETAMLRNIEKLVKSIDQTNKNIWNYYKTFQDALEKDK